MLFQITQSPVSPLLDSLHPDPQPLRQTPTYPLNAILHRPDHKLILCCRPQNLQASPSRCVSRTHTQRKRLFGDMMRAFIIVRHGEEIFDVRQDEAEYEAEQDYCC